MKFNFIENVNFERLQCSPIVQKNKGWSVASLFFALPKNFHTTVECCCEMHNQKKYVNLICVLFNNTEYY